MEGDDDASRVPRLEGREREREREIEREREREVASCLFLGHVFFAAL